MSDLTNLPKFYTKWSIVGWNALFILMATIIVLTVNGFNEHGGRLALKMTGAISALFFLSAFLASSLHKIKPTLISRWLLQNRRYFGVSFAASHFIHLITLVTLVFFSEPFLNSLKLQAVIPGSLGYIFLTAMTLTSFDKTAAWLEKTRWIVLHTVGSYYLWLIFFFTYFSKLSHSTMNIIFTALFITAPIIRIGSYFKK